MSWFRICFLSVFGLLGMAIVPTSVHALTEADIVFPIAELGGCAHEEACKVYCDDPSNITACLDFAERYNLLSPDELSRARTFQNLQTTVGAGPGGCTSPQQCEAYCNEVTHINECLQYAAEHALLDDLELEEARKVQQALARGAMLPGGCTSKESCEAYCEIEVHLDECIAFAENAGFIDAGEAALMREPDGKGPGGCVAEECIVYCSDPENHAECDALSHTHDMVGKEDGEFTEGVPHGPGGCRSEEECAAYCSNPAHQFECTGGETDSSFPPHDMPPDDHTFMLGGLPDAVKQCVEAELDLNDATVPIKKLEETIGQCFSKHDRPPEVPFDPEYDPLKVNGYDHKDWPQGLPPVDFKPEWPEQYQDVHEHTIPPEEYEKPWSEELYPEPEENERTNLFQRIGHLLSLAIAAVLW